LVERVSPSFLLLTALGRLAPLALGAAPLTREAAAAARDGGSGVGTSGVGHLGDGGAGVDGIGSACGAGDVFDCGGCAACEGGALDEATTGMSEMDFGLSWCGAGYSSCLMATTMAPSATRRHATAMAEMGVTRAERWRARVYSGYPLDDEVTCHGDD